LADFVTPLCVMNRVRPGFTKVFSIAPTCKTFSIG
jgi:hypothetical protein